VKLVSNPQFAAMMQEKINMKVDTTAIDQEIDNYEKQLRQDYSIKSKLMEEIDNLNPDDRHYIRRKADLDDRLYRMYDKIEELEEQLIAAKAKKTSIEAEKITGDNIYKVLIYFDKLYFAMNDVERRQLIEALIAEIQIYEERKPNGQWLKSIRFKLPIIENNLSVGLDNEQHVETIVQLSQRKPDDVVEVDLDLDELDITSAETKATYNEIKQYILEQTGLRVTNLYIAQVKQKCGIIERENYNKPKSENSKQPKCTPEKEVAILDALKHFNMI
jgi:site-specific DNA recombinase